jgi:cytochrome c oxidase subunit II
VVARQPAATAARGASALVIAVAAAIARAAARLPLFPGAFLRDAGGAGIGLLRAQADPTFWLPMEGSTAAPTVDRLFYFILAVATVFFLLVVFLMTLFVLRYRRPKGALPEGRTVHNTPLELTWTAIPLILVIVIFFLGFKGYMDINTAPQNAYEILVTGQKWSWQFTYPDGYVDSELHVPLDRPVLLTLTSVDVIHGFYIPAFRIKKDVVPGRYNKVWFRATVPGEYVLTCTQYCGTEHSSMMAKVIVHPPGGFETWLAGAADVAGRLPPAEAGEKLFKSKGCASCHTINGTVKIGPSFRGLFAGTVILSDGRKVTADEDYVRESILDPAAKVVAGFDPVMPTYKGRITDKEITALIEYLKTLKQ